MSTVRIGPPRAPQLSRLEQLLAGMGRITAETTEAQYLSVGAAYRLVRSEYMAEHGIKKLKDGKTRPCTTTGQMAWLRAVWTRPEFVKFVQLRARFDHTNIIDWEFAAFRAHVLRLMGSATEGPYETHLAHIVAQYRTLRWDYANVVARYMRFAEIESGQARRYIESIWETPEWRHYKRLKAKAWHSTPEGRAKRNAAAKTYYEEQLKAKRSTPEAKAKLAEQRRAKGARVRSEASMEQRRAYAKQYYEEQLKAKRSTPEAKAKLAEQRRARYARAKAARAAESE